MRRSKAQFHYISALAARWDWKINSKQDYLGN